MNYTRKNVQPKVMIYVYKVNTLSEFGVCKLYIVTSSYNK